MAQLRLGLAAGLFLVASVAHAQDNLEGQVVGAIRGVGCVVGPLNLDQALAAAGLSRAEADPVIERLQSEGALTPYDYGPEAGGVWLNLSMELCQGGTPRERLLEVLRISGCDMDAEALAFRIERASPEDGDVQAIIDELIAAGDAKMNNGGIKLAAPLCRGNR